MGVCNCSMFCCMLLYVHSSIAIILMGKRELIALLNLSSWCLVMVERLFLAVPRGCLQFVIVVFPDHTHLLFLSSYWSQCFQILCTPSGRQSVLCKWKLRCLSSFCLLFSIFHFFLLSLLFNTYGHFQFFIFLLLSLLYNSYGLFSVNDFSATT